MFADPLSLARRCLSSSTSLINFFELSSFSFRTSLMASILTVSAKEEMKMCFFN